ncbi:hypothetical protein FRA_24c00930 [Francisella sp. W12-1067]|nr:hypothetical protein FRA_24c00930 [Francisella sp. W12-1067]
MVLLEGAVESIASSSRVSAVTTVLLSFFKFAKKHGIEVEVEEKQ